MLPLSTKQVLRKLGGDKISGKVYTFDGNTEGHTTVPFDNDITFTKVSNDMPDLDKIVSLFMTENFGSGTEQISAEEIILQEVKAGDTSLYGAVGTVLLYLGVSPFVVVVTDTGTSPIPETGLYFMRQNDGAYWISSAEFPETFHPIDPKFLPPMGGGLPVVKLTTEPAAEGVRLTDEESAAIRAAWTDGLPAVISFAYYGTSVSGVFSYFGGVYTMTSFGVNFSVEDTDGGNLTFSVIEP